MFEKIKLFINKLGRKMINATNDVQEKRYIEYQISKWKHSIERTQQIKGEEYYKGRHDILLRQRKAIGKDGNLQVVKNLPNNRVVNNQYSKMVDQKKNYLLSQPIVFTSKNERYNEELNKIFNKEFTKIINNLGCDCLNGGIAWLLPYYDEEGNFKFKNFPAYEILPLWEDKKHTKLKLAIRYYTEETENFKEYVELYTEKGIFYYELINNNLFPKGNQPYLTIENNEVKQYNWAKLPLIPFKFNNDEIPLITKCKSIQDSINVMMSDYVNIMEENAGGNSIIVLKNFDGENLGEFREKLIELKAVKVRTVDGADGDVKTLNIEVNKDNYESVLKLLKQQLIENCRGFDSKDDRMSNNPNQMNIQSMLMDIDLDANEMESEFTYSFNKLLWFVNQHLANTGKGSFESEDVEIIFNRDSIVNENELVSLLLQAGVKISNKTLLSQVPFIDNIENELDQIKKEQEEEMNVMNVYGDNFNKEVVNEDKQVLEK